MIKLLFRECGGRGGGGGRAGKSISAEKLLFQNQLNRQSISLREITAFKKLLISTFHSKEDQILDD